eukprot:9543517-Ditylum_brightwellii.AAC.1
MLSSRWRSHGWSCVQYCWNDFGVVIGCECALCHVAGMEQYLWLPLCDILGMGGRFVGDCTSSV